MALNELKYQFKVSEDGVIHVVNRKQFEADMKAMFAGKTAIGVFRKARRLRSSPQNRYYHGVVVNEVFDGLVAIGYDRNQLSHEIVHDMLRAKFLTVDLPCPDMQGEYITVTKSTTELGVGEMMDYMAEISKWANEFLGISIPEPNEQKEIDYE